MPQLFLGLNARCFRALELTQAAWRRDRLAKTEENKVESSREDFVCYTLVIEIGSGALSGLGCRGDERRSRSRPWPSTCWTRRR